MPERQISVKVLALGRSKEEILLEPPYTVEHAIARINTDPTTVHGVHVNGQKASLDTQLEDGDTVVLVPRVKHGS